MYIYAYTYLYIIWIYLHVCIYVYMYIFDSKSTQQFPINFLELATSKMVFLNDFPPTGVGVMNK